MDFHGRMMNILTRHETIVRMGQTAINETDGLVQAAQRAYQYGHRDARHAAAEIANEADAEICALREIRDRLGDVERALGMPVEEAIAEFGKCRELAMRLDCLTTDAPDTFAGTVSERLGRSIKWLTKGKETR